MTDQPEKPGLLFRSMTLDDLDQVENIDRISFSMPWPKQAFHYELTQNKNSICCVAEWNEPGKKLKIIGAIVLWLVVDEVHVSTLAVHPDYRHRGIAQRLLAHALMLSAQAGVNQALLEVRASNLAAQNLYRKFGFKVVGIRKGYYEDVHEDALLMTLANLNTAQLAEWAEGE